MAQRPRPAIAIILGLLLAQMIWTVNKQRKTVKQFWILDFRFWISDFELEFRLSSKK
jgi:hypothetical protein